MKMYSGHLSVVAILENDKREVQELFINKSKRSKIIAYALSLAYQKQIKINILSDKEFKMLNIENSGGIACLASVQKPFLTKKDAKLILLIEGVEDPYNVGNLIRSAYISGFDAVCFDKKRFELYDDVILRSSAGCFDRLLIYDLELLDELVSYGYNFVALHRSNHSILLNDFDCNKLPLVLCVGGEKRGLSKKVLNYCKEHVLLENFSDLGLAYSSVAAGAIAMYYIGNKLNKEK